MFLLLSSLFNFFLQVYDYCLTGMKSGNKSQQRWLPDRRNVTTILPCAMRERMTRRKGHHPRRPDPVSRERFMGRVNRNRTIRASRAVYRRLYSPLGIILMLVHQILGLFSSKAAECVIGKTLLSVGTSAFIFKAGSRFKFVE